MQVSQTPPSKICTLESPKSEHQNILLCIRMHTKGLVQRHSKMITSGIKQHLYSQSLHPTYHCIHFGLLPLQAVIYGSTQEAFHP
jgi:hypothetical protein